jgi:two-component system response regulator HydG
MKKQSSILIVDDDNAHRTMLKTLISGWGYGITEAEDGSDAIEFAEKEPFDLILMDIRMLKVSGLEALEKIKAINPSIPIIIMTAFSSVETAISALKNGAYDYLTKPLDFDKLKITIERATEHLRLKNENRMLKASLSDTFNTGNIIGKSPKMIKLLETIAQVAPTEATLLINGESGTGKELVAGATHYNSTRMDGPFVKINCAAITDTLLESELFGHEKGSFTGADKKKEGRFVQASGGSLFLDEVSEMPLSMQVKLLRVLQERELTRVGGEEVIKIDVRLIVASNKDLKELVEKGLFREDLYYRLNVVDITIPPLRDRKGDIPLLAQHFLEAFSEKNKKNFKGFTPEAMDLMIRHSWPGNVRELMNAVERGVVLSNSEFIDCPSLPVNLDGKEDNDHSYEEESLTDGMQPLEDIEKRAILTTLEAAGGNKSEAARRLGITRKTLHKKLNSYGEKG